MDVKTRIFEYYRDRLEVHDEGELRRILRIIDDRELLLPMVSEDLQKGTDMGMVAIRYNLSKSAVWRIGERLGIYPKYKSREEKKGRTR